MKIDNQMITSKTFNSPNDGINANGQKYFYPFSQVIIAILAELRDYIYIIFTILMYLLWSRQLWFTDIGCIDLNPIGLALCTCDGIWETVLV